MKKWCILNNQTKFFTGDFIMFSASDLRKGLKIEIDGQPWIITEFDFCKPGKGTALYRCKMKNLVTGAGMEKTYRPTDKIEKPDLEERELFYSYNDGHNYVFSDPETYEEMQVSPEFLGNNIYFLIEEKTAYTIIAIIINHTKHHNQSVFNKHSNPIIRNNTANKIKMIAA